MFHARSFLLERRNGCASPGCFEVQRQIMKLRPWSGKIHSMTKCSREMTFSYNRSVLMNICDYYGNAFPGGTSLERCFLRPYSGAAMCVYVCCRGRGFPNSSREERCLRTGRLSLEFLLHLPGWARKKRGQLGSNEILLLRRRPDGRRYSDGICFGWYRLHCCFAWFSCPPSKS